MKQMVYIIVLVFSLLGQSSSGDVPQIMSYQGLLASGSGIPVTDGNYNLTFKLYNIDAGGSALWTEAHSSVVIVKGVFNVILGSINPLSLPFDQQYWLGITVGAGTELTPRLRLTSAAYSLNAQTSNDAWKFTGNAGTSPPTHFLGTTDSMPLELRVNSMRAWRLEPNATSPNIIGGYKSNWLKSGVYGATIAGGGKVGELNRITDRYGVVSGGSDNQAGNDTGTIEDANYATVGGGFQNTASGNTATISGGGGNQASGAGATVGGGLNHKATDELVTIGGGGENNASGKASTVGGGQSNSASADYATIAGGGRLNLNDPATGNRVTDDYGTIGGGGGNLAGTDNGDTFDAICATVSGGLNNMATGYGATVSGGWGNTATALYATVGGGFENQAADQYSTIAGGTKNTATDLYSTVAGGTSNTATGYAATVGGGVVNKSNAAYATIAGGGLADQSDLDSGNLVTDDYGTIGGGGDNQAGNASGDTKDATFATVAGGIHNVANDEGDAVGGGQLNKTAGGYNTIGGGYDNRAGGDEIGNTWRFAAVGGGNTNKAISECAFIGGGLDNTVTDFYGTVGGGLRNQAGDNAGVANDRRFATVGGGADNTASGEASTIGGGSTNTANSAGATIGGGWNNGAMADFATVAGGGSDTTGKGNRATEPHSTVSGGFNNIASGEFATVCGGGNNTAGGYSGTVAGGVWNQANGQFSFAAGRQAKATHDGSFVWNDNSGSDFASSGENRFMARAAGGVYFYTNSALSAGIYLAAGASSWTGVSDKRMKRNIRQVDGREILSKLAQIPINQWSYKAQDPNIEHIGPMAQDFYAAFGLGEDDKHINTLDPDGVALAAIQGLYEIVQDKEAENASLRQQVNDLKERLEALELMILQDNQE